MFTVTDYGDRAVCIVPRAPDAVEARRIYLEDHLGPSEEEINDLAVMDFEGLVIMEITKADLKNSKIIQLWG